MKLRDETAPGNEYTPFSLRSFDTLQDLMSALEQKATLEISKPYSLNSNPSLVKKLLTYKKPRIESNLVNEDKSLIEKSTPQKTSSEVSTTSIINTNVTETLPLNEPIQIKFEIDERRGMQTRSRSSLKAVVTQPVNNPVKKPVKAPVQKKAGKKKSKPAKSKVIPKKVKVERTDFEISENIFSPADVVIDLPQLPEFPSEVRRESRNYQLVCNIGFASIEKNGQRQILFKCFLAGCPFVLFDQASFVEHLKLKHSTVVWQRYCNACCGIADFHYTVTIMDEMEHMINCHLKQVMINPKAKAQPPTRTSFELVDNSLNNSFKDSSAFADDFFSGVPPIKLRPWLNQEINKDNYAAASMLQENCLAAMFKCMEKSCVFFTSLDSIFADHLKCHRLQERSEGQDKCAYCDFKATDDNELVDHISNEHKYDMYQCTICFYRSASSANVHSHIRIYHPLKALVIIECLPRQRTYETMLIKLAKSEENVRKLVRPMFCLVCQKQFFVIGAYESHIKSHDQFRSFEENCTKCEKVIKAETLSTHFESCEKVGLYQCLFCLFGCNSLNVLKLHMANRHPSKLPIYCKRAGDQKVNSVFVQSI